VEDGLDQVGNLESALEPMPTFTSVNPAPCRVGSPHAGFYRSKSKQANQKRHLSGDVQRSVACFGTSRPTEGFITPPSTDFRAQLRGGELFNEPAKEAEVSCAMVGNHGGTKMIAAF
jgi:hypothetical protein